MSLLIGTWSGNPDTTGSNTAFEKSCANQKLREWRPESALEVRPNGVTTSPTTQFAPSVIAESLQNFPHPYAYSLNPIVDTRG